MKPPSPQASRPAEQNPQAPLAPAPPLMLIAAPTQRFEAQPRSACGEVAEWSIASHSKCEVRASVPGVRIPPSPPAINLNLNGILARALAKYTAAYTWARLSFGCAARLSGSRSPFRRISGQPSARRPCGCACRPEFVGTRCRTLASWQVAPNGSFGTCVCVASHNRGFARAPAPTPASACTRNSSRKSMRLPTSTAA